ncbi:MAG: Hint domain-containing protein [Rhodobacteraceae bacterium]|nr:Hint domain-containing protein [Paracoccaceae bacterium]
MANIVGDGGDNSLVGTWFSDDIRGLGGNDTLRGLQGRDSLQGGDGADLLDGGDGRDTLSGGTGNDTLIGGDGSDRLDGGSGTDFADYSGSGAGVNVDLAAGTGAGGDAQGDTLAGVDGLIGSAHDDTLRGFDGQSDDPADTYTNIFFGGDGNDLLDGRGGDDLLYGDAGNDTVLGGRGNDLIDGGDGADSLVGGDGRDTLFGNLGDFVDGSEGGDDFDTLDLTGRGPLRILYDPDNPENGIVQFLDADGNVIGTLTFRNIEDVVPCFAAGTRIATATGLRPVETIAAGDLVLTRDRGLRPVRWAGARRLGTGELLAAPSLLPVRIAAGALAPGAPARDLVLSPQHRLLLAGARAELLFGEAEVLAPAVQLMGLRGVSRDPPRPVTYHHLLFEDHEILLSEGAWSESFQPGAASLRGLDRAQREEIRALFPDLGGDTPMPAARPSLRGWETRALMAA